MLNMEHVQNYSNLNALTKLHYMCEINIRNFRNLAVISTSYGHLIDSGCLNLLPHKLLIEYH